VGSANDRRDGGALGAIAGFFLWLVGIFVFKLLIVNRTQPVVKKIDDDYGHLKFPNPDLTRRVFEDKGQK
jgi:hypothetical protein